MDEMLAIIKGLWTQKTFAYQGEHFTIPEVRLEPKPVQRPHPPIWVAGGTVPPGSSKHITTSKGYTPERSLRRAAELADGFMTAYRSCPGLDMSQLVSSWASVTSTARQLGRDPDRIRFAHQDHLHIDAYATPDRLREAFQRFSHNPFEQAAPMYLMGHPEELIPRFQARIDAGVQELTFNLMVPDPKQLDLFVRHIRPHLHPQA